MTATSCRGSGPTDSTNDQFETPTERVLRSPPAASSPASALTSRPAANLLLPTARSMPQDPTNPYGNVGDARSKQDLIGDRFKAPCNTFATLTRR
jgi:hypothetical protein